MIFQRTKDKLKNEVITFFGEKGIENTEEKLIQWLDFAEFQMKDDTYWSPCENCINVNCIRTEDFPMWFCPYQK